MNPRNASDPKPCPVYPNREGRNARLHELDLKSLPYVPLPRAPLRWGLDPVVREKHPKPRMPSKFAMPSGDSQRSKSCPPPSVPTPPFGGCIRLIAGCSIDDLGKAKGFGPIQAAALPYDRDGRLAARAGFARGIYRLGVHPLGRGLVAMSPDCVLHAYDEDLQPVFETALANAPEIQALSRRIDICEERLKNHIRCVALSRDHQRYLFTAVDESLVCQPAEPKNLGNKAPPAGKLEADCVAGRKVRHEFRNTRCACVDEVVAPAHPPTDQATLS